MAVTIPATGAHVIQVLTTSTSTTVTNNSSSYVGTGLSLSITPKSTASKILILAGIPHGMGSNNYVYNQFQITKGGVELKSLNVGNSVNAYIYTNHMFHIVYMDAPASTSSLTYAINFRFSGSGSGLYVGEIFCPAGTSTTASKASLTLMEISGD